MEASLTKVLFRVFLTRNLQSAEKYQIHGTTNCFTTAWNSEVMSVHSNHVYTWIKALTFTQCSPASDSNRYHMLYHATWGKVRFVFVMCTSSVQNFTEWRPSTNMWPTSSIFRILPYNTEPQRGQTKCALYFYLWNTIVLLHQNQVT